MDLQHTKRTGLRAQGWPTPGQLPRAGKRRIDAGDLTAPQHLQGALNTPLAYALTASLPHI